MSRVVINDSEFLEKEAFCLEKINQYITLGNNAIVAINTVLNEGIIDGLISSKLAEKTEQINEVLHLLQNLQLGFAGKTQNFLFNVDEIDRVHS